MPAPKYTAARQQGGAGAQSEGDGAGGKQGPLTEELDLDTSHTPDDPVAEQAQQVVGRQGLSAGGRRPGTGRDDLHPEARPQGGEPVEQLGGLEDLHHHGDRVAGHGQVGAAPLPAAKMRQGEDDAAADRQGALEMLEAFVAHPGPDPLGRESAESEALGPIPTVRRERLFHLAAGPAGRWVVAVDPAEVGGQQLSSPAQAVESDRGRHAGGEPTSGFAHGTADGAGQDAGGGRARLEGGQGRRTVTRADQGRRLP